MKETMLTFWEWIKSKNYQWRFKLFVAVPLIILLLVIDWTTKSWASHHLTYGQSTDWAPGFLNFRYVINQGSAYGAMADHPGTVIALASIITIVCCALFLMSSNYLIIMTFAVIFAGSFGNLLARAWAPNDGNTKNGVIDFLVWDFWGMGSYIFNMADLFVNIGIGLAILAVIFYVVTLLMDFYLKKNHPAEYEEIEEIRGDNNRIAAIIEKAFWTTKFPRWWTERKVLIAKIQENKAKIKLLKGKKSKVKKEEQEDNGN